MLVDKVKTDRIEVWKAEIIQREYVKEILSKIKDEIDEKISHYEHFSSSNTANGLMMAKEIIDKYIEGSDSE